MADRLTSVHAGADRSALPAGAPARLAFRKPGALPFFGAIARLVQTWQRRRRDRRMLGHLDTHLLRDIGLDPTTALLETEKPFWRD